jgi:CDP-2,3-bis-(O-geranylgeranyl)-sn-glycerol synthase
VARDIAWLMASSLYLFSPLLAAAALSAVVIRFDLLGFLKRPIDGGRSWRGARLFGESKTWRGVATAVVGCTLAVALQRTLAGWAEPLELVDYAAVNPPALGVAMGAGAMLGELPNSFLKRRLGIAPGGTARGGRAILFYVWDQVDLLTGAWPLMLPWLRPSAELVVTSVAMALSIHPVVALVGYLLGARKTPR